MPGFNEELEADSGSYVQETPSFDVTQFYELAPNSNEFKELIVRLAQQVNNLSIVLNNKQSGYHLDREFNTGGLLFKPNSTSSQQQDLRNIYRRVYDIGVLPAGGIAVPHGLNFDANWRFVHLYGMANDPGVSAYPINSVYIGAIINGPNIVITNILGVGFPSCYIVLEYVKSN